MNCNDCGKNKTCKKLCKRAEMWANKDHIQRRESFRLPTVDDDDADEAHTRAVVGGNWEETTKNKKTLIYEMHFRDHLTVTEIAAKLYVSKQYISKIIKKIVLSTTKQKTKQ